MASPSRNRVRTTEKSFTIVEELERSDGAGVTELSSALDMNKSTVHSHLSTLVDCGYVTKHDQQYHVSTKFLSLGGRLRDRSPLYRAARPELVTLAASTGGVARLALKERDRVTTIAQEGYHPSVQETHLGQQVAATESVAGLAILAELAHEDREDAWSRSESAFDADVAERLDQIRRRGYAVETRSEQASERTFAAPLAGRDEVVMGALTVSVPAGDVAADPPPDERLLEAVERTELNITSWYDTRVTFSPKHSWHVRSR